MNHTHEKHMAKAESRKERISDWGTMVTNAGDGYPAVSFPVYPQYASLAELLSPQIRTRVEALDLGGPSASIRLSSRSGSAFDEFNEVCSVLRREIARIEKKWDLV